MDNKDPNCYTVIFSGMHKYIKDWWVKVYERNLAKNEFIHRIDNKIFTKEDEEEFNTKWTFQPCKRGDVRITQSTFPHGSDGPATDVRRIILP